MNRGEHIQQYFDGIKQLFEQLDIRAIEEFTKYIESAMGKDIHLYICGNGGSGATASHMVNDINKGISFGSRKRLKAHCLSDNVATLMAYANDESYDCVFEEQLKNFLCPQDIVIAISASGNSPNVIRAVQYAKSLGATTLGMTGFDGGKLKPMVDVCLHVPIHDMQKVEDLHLMFNHIMMQLLMLKEKVSS